MLGSRVHPSLLCLRPGSPQRFPRDCGQRVQPRGPPWRCEGPRREGDACDPREDQGGTAGGRPRGKRGSPQLARRPWEAGGTGTEPLRKVQRPLPPAEDRRASEAAAPWRRPRPPPQSRVQATRGRGHLTAHAPCRPMGGHLADPRHAPRRRQHRARVLEERCQPARMGFLRRVCPVLLLSPQLGSPLSLHPSLASSRARLLSFRALRGAWHEHALRTNT